MANHHHALADAQGAGLPPCAAAVPLGAAANEARFVLHRLLGDIARLRSNVVALKLAADQEAMTKGGSLYWPDLLAGIEALIPNDEPVDRALEHLVDALRLRR